MLPPGPAFKGYVKIFYIAASGPGCARSAKDFRMLKIPAAGFLTGGAQSNPVNFC